MKPSSTSITVLLATAISVVLSSWSAAAERVAFVVGNDDYTHGAKLRNAVSDAKLISVVLEKCGFEVIALQNAGIEAFYEGLDRFNRAAASADVGLVYYAGHGIEVDGDNFLLPTDAKLENRSQLRTQAIALDTVLRDMEDAKLPVKLAILDCCRDNPLSRSWMISRSGTRGGGLGELRDESLPEVSMVMYSARPGQVAFDGEQGNSPFSLALAGRLATPGMNVFDAFYRTADDVMRATGDRQEPWVKADGSAQAIRRLVFVPSATPQPQPRPFDPNAFPSTLSPAPSPAPAIGTMSVTTEHTPGTIGNSPEADPAPETKDVAIAGPPSLPPRGYFQTDEVFASGPYAEYNSYSKSQILRSAQTKLPGAGSADGNMGPKTQAAIMAFQASCSINVTGLLDRATIVALELIDIAEHVKPKSSSYSKSGGSRNYNGGSSSKRSGGGGSLESRAAGAAARAVLGF